MEMELVILFVALVALDALAMRFGVDSRVREADTWSQSEATHAQI
jgi:hypothetical protein